MKIYQAIAQIISESGETQISWANRVGMTSPQLSRFLNGKKQINTDTLEALLMSMDETQRLQFQEMVFGESESEKQLLAV